MKKLSIFIFMLLLLSNLDAAFHKKLARKKQPFESEYVHEDIGLSGLDETILTNEEIPLQLNKRFEKLETSWNEIETEVNKMLENYNFPKRSFKFDFRDYDYEGLKDFIFDQEDKLAFAEFVSGIVEQGIVVQLDLLSDNSGNLDNMLELATKRMNNKNSLREYNSSIGGYLEKIDLTKNEIDLGFKTFCIGDLHGNFDAFDKIIQDLIDQNILNKNLKIQNNNKIVFLGDFVDRGDNSLEISLFIIILKILNPEMIVILQGNHENFIYFSHYGFLEELKHKVLNKDFINSLRNIKKKIDYLKMNFKLLNYNIKDNFLATIESKILAFDKLFNYFPKKFADYFFLLPSAFFYKTPDNQYFQFNHAGYVLLKHNSRELNFLRSQYKYLENDITQFTWNDLLLDENINECVSSSRGEGLITCPKKLVLTNMKKRNILAKFGGHQHNLPKQQNVDRDEKYFGACCFANESLNNYIYIIISGTIRLASNLYEYYPSYLELDIKGDEWNVNGHCLGCNDNESKIIKF